METPDVKSRPVLVVSRDSANAAMRRVVVAPVTTTIRPARSQLALGVAEGLLVDSVANFDDIMSVPTSYLVRRMGSIEPRLHEVCAALTVMADC